MSVLYTFVAGKALEKNDPFVLKCNCGGAVTIMPPFQEEQVVCIKCESIIKILVIEGDHGFIIGKNADDEITLLPVQGSSKDINEITSEEKNKIIENVKKNMKEMEINNGNK